MGAWFAFGFLPLVVTVPGLLDVVTHGPGKSDFWTFWLASHTVLHGGDPYPAIASLPASVDKTFAPFVYPPVAAFLLAPLALLPFVVAKVVFYLLNLAALGVALRLLRVRDWRCYGAALASPPIVEASGIGTISIWLLLGVAAAWHWRRRTVALGAVVAGLITAKLFLWPLWFWLVRTRRYRAAAAAVALAAAAVCASWAAIGFAGLRDYPVLLGRLTGLEGVHGYSVYALLRAFDVGHGRAAQAGTLLGLVVLAGVLRFVPGDRRVLAALIGASLLATPILWPHYLVLLYVPVAFVSRRFSWIWLAPLALWLDAHAWSDGRPWRIVGELLVGAVVVGAAVVPRLRAPVLSWRSGDRGSGELPAVVTADTATP